MSVSTAKHIYPYMVPVNVFHLNEGGKVVAKSLEWWWANQVDGGVHDTRDPKGIQFNWNMKAWCGKTMTVKELWLGDNLYTKPYFTVEENGYLWIDQFVDYPEDF